MHQLKSFRSIIVCCVIYNIKVSLFAFYNNRLRCYVIWDGFVQTSTMFFVLAFQIILSVINAHFVQTNTCHYEYDYVLSEMQLDSVLRRLKMVF